MSSKVSNRVNKGIKTALVKNVIHGQFQYLGRWVNKDQFRAFVYNAKGEQTLADNYSEYEKLTNSGIWFDTIDNAKNIKKVATQKVENIKDSKASTTDERKQDDGTIRSTS